MQPKAIQLKSDREIELMRSAGRLVNAVLGRMREMVAPGVTTGELDREAERIIVEGGGEGLFKNYPNHKPGGPPFPSVICASVNEEVVHGIPGRRKLVEGDIISIDCGVRLAGYCGDSAVTLGVGQASEDATRLMEVTRRTLELAISMLAPGRFWSEVAKAMQACVEDAGFSVVTEYVGHGIGMRMHEPPKVPNFWNRHWVGEDFELREGMTLAIEPMVNLGRADVKNARDEWTILTRDGRPSAHFEHTVAVRATGPDVLTDGH
ncbi:MAG: Methionine aminopeptidase 1 [Phycisphaerae bacterium]|nr:Methionine aminopeptidase 1 [Phycisphaerae bacterium]